MDRLIDDDIGTVHVYPLRASCDTTELKLKASILHGYRIKPDPYEPLLPTPLGSARQAFPMRIFFSGEAL